MDYNLKQEVKRLMDIFEDSFINRNFELILEERRNLYVNFELVKTVKDLKMNMIQWKSRACIKGDDEKILIKTRKKFNEFFKKDFSLEDLELIYELLGNEVNPDLCERFINSDLNIEILKNYKCDNNG